MAICVTVCLSLAVYCTDLYVTWGNGRALFGRFAIGAQVSLLIALYTANAYSTECEMSGSACTRSVAGCILVTDA